MVPRGLVMSLGSLSFIGESPAFREVMRSIHQMAQCEATVLIQGETGTGKEMAARYLHYRSKRCSGPFLPVNCGAIPDTLLESELFGHVRGAFTDAKQHRQGLVEQAAGGTLFLDELEAISPRAQVVLLRFLQDHEYRPVGGFAGKKGDVRVIGASNLDLGDLVARGDFRQDLFFRLNVLVLTLPALRHRGDDIVLLAERFMDRCAREYRLVPKKLTAAEVTALRAHSWPGNVRELENVILRKLLLTDEHAATPRSNLVSTPDSGRDDTPAALTHKSFHEAKALAVANFEKAYITELLARTSGNVSLAARLCGKERSRLTKLIKKHGLQREYFVGTAGDS